MLGIGAHQSRPTLVSRGQRSEPADRACLLPDLSHDGNVATFQSQATTLVGGKATDLATDVYLNEGGATEAITRGDNLSRNASLSADGRYVAFSSRSRNLTEDPTEWEQIYLRDRATGETRCLTPGADQNCTEPDISADGRFVTFTSYADLEASGGPYRQRVYVVDTQTGQLESISQKADGTPANHSSDQPTISGDGRLVVFRSRADNLVAGDDNRVSDIFLKDRKTGTLTCLTQGSLLGASAPVISADGNKVALVSNSNLVGDEAPYVGGHVFVKDLTDGSVIRASSSSLGTPGDADAWTPDISADGRYVVFTSGAANLVANDDNDHRDIFVHDTMNRQTFLVSEADYDEQTDGDSLAPAISGDGQTIAFFSEARNLAPPGPRVHGSIFAVDNPASPEAQERRFRSALEPEGETGGGVQFGEGSVEIGDVWLPRTS